MRGFLVSEHDACRALPTPRHLLRAQQVLYPRSPSPASSRHQLRRAGVISPFQRREHEGPREAEPPVPHLELPGQGAEPGAPPRSPRAPPRSPQPPPLPMPLPLAWSVSATGTGRVPGTLRSAVTMKVCGSQLTSVTPGKRERVQRGGGRGGPGVQSRLCHSSGTQASQAATAFSSVTWAC